MINFTWTIKELSTINTSSINNFVVKVAYEVQAQEGEYTVSAGDVIDFSFEAGQEYVPYSSLTQETVVSWVKNELGESKVSKAENYLTEQIELLKNPLPEVTKDTLPWA